MADPYEVDGEGNPVAEPDAVVESDPATAEAQAALRRQVDQTLRFMRVQTAVGFVVLLVLIVVLSDLRGVMILVTLVFMLTSGVAYTFLRRQLNARVLRGVPAPAPSASAADPTSTADDSVSGPDR